ncbi:MAG: PQQ-dependent sugar dehydrogenase [Flavobacteriales bacterium]|nr:MAG: PQQ-dependent sugar dehydrogenase [Flavobacteriales bacterium]
MTLRTIPAACALGLCLSATGQETPITLQVEQVATGLTRITDISHCGDDRLFLTLQGGTIRILDADNTLLATPFLNITSRVNSSGNEQGLLGLAFDPDYSTNGRFYVYYTNGSGSGTSRISRFTVSADPNVADPDSEEILYTAAQPYTNHNGGDIEFGPDGYLYIGFGDGGSGGDPQNLAQNMSSPLGKMIRIDVSGETGWAVPPDNPFVGQTSVLPEIWASGLRNPWRWGFDAETGDLWIGDVGQNAVEEVSYWPAGDNSGPNFGWRCYEANATYNTGGCQPASAYVTPATSHIQSQQGWCSVIGGRVYRGGTYWRIEGRYIYTDYCGGQFYGLRRDEFGAWVRTQHLASGLYGFSCIGENSGGELFAGNNSNGRLYRIKEACPAPAPVIALDGNGLVSTAALGYQWYLNGTAIPGAVGQSYTPTENGDYRVLANTETGCQIFSNIIEITTTGLAEGDASGATVRPIPADAVIWVDGIRAPGAAAELLDAQGRRVRAAAPLNSGSIALDTQELPAGLYTVRLLGPDGTVLLRRNVPVAH